MQNRPQFGFAITYVSDMDAAKHFYADVLGLKIEREHPSFVQFQNFALATDESLSGTRELELYWLIDDAEAAFRDLSQKAEITLPLTQKPFGTVFGVKDPDGQPRYMLEFSSNRPSRSV
jgi:catechol 2,3-dioxygenase-like lactoylglutathione lyase family enzyme